MISPVKILLVDDEPSIIKMVGKRLEFAGYQVVAAMDGQEALEKAQSELPDLIILDLMLPKLNGYSVCATLRRDPRFQKTPIMMLTARVQEKDEQLGMACGANVYVRKPFKGPELVDRVKELLGQKSSATS